jgi:hypothetical protein
MGSTMWPERDFRLAIVFKPTFLVASRVVLEKRGELTTLAISLGIDERQKAIGGDLRNCDQLERVPVAEGAFAEFQRRAGPLRLSMQKDLKKNMLDGITVSFRFEDGSSDHSFSYTCPDRSDPSEFKIIEALFDLFECSFEMPETVNYVERLKGYFDFGLLVKKTSESPLEYRFYSHLSANEAEEFWQFLAGLPADRPVIFDMTNFGGMGTMFYDAIRAFLARNRDVYWLVSPSTAEQVIEIGVRPDRILRSRSGLPGTLRTH